MGNSESKTEYNIKYAKAKLKRIPLDVQKEKYEEAVRHVPFISMMKNMKPICAT